MREHVYTIHKQGLNLTTVAGSLTRVYGLMQVFAGNQEIVRLGTHRHRHPCLAMFCRWIIYILKYPFFWSLSELSF